MTNSSCKECAELERELYGIKPKLVTSPNYMRRTCYACGELLEGNYYAVNFHNSMSDEEKDIRDAVAQGDLYKAHTLAHGQEWVHETKAQELGLDFGELCAPWKSKWGQDLLDNVNPWVSEAPSACWVCGSFLDGAGIKIGAGAQVCIDCEEAKGKWEDPRLDEYGRLLKK